MNLQEKIRNISSTSKLPELQSGKSVDLDEFWTKFIEPLLPDKAVVEAWHKVLMEYLKEKEPIFILRAFGSYPNKTNDRKSLRRGFLNLTNISLSVVYVDNFFTSYFFSMAYDGYVPDYQEFKDMMLSRKFPLGYIITSTEKKYAAFEKGADPKIQQKGYKIAHIHASGCDFDMPNGIDTIGKFCAKYFPRGNYDDWDHTDDDEYGCYNYRKILIDSDDESTVRDFLVAHFLRTVHPINYFLVPKQECISFIDNGKIKNEIGEYPALVKYVKQKIKERYGAIYDQYHKLIKAVDDKDVTDTATNTLIDAVFGFQIDSKPKAEKKACSSRIRQAIDTPRIGKVVCNRLIPGLSKGKVTPDEIQKLQTSEYSKEVFDINYPLLSKDRFDSNSYPRYYADKICINGEYWYVCSQWYDRSLAKLNMWLASHKID